MILETYALTNQIQRKENYDEEDDKDKKNSSTTVYYYDNPPFIFLSVYIILTFIMFIWALIALIMYSKFLPQPYFALALLFLILSFFGLGPFGSIITLIIIYSTKSKRIIKH